MNALPRDYTTMSRLAFETVYGEERRLLEALYRLVPEPAVTVVHLDHSTVRISCYLSNSEFKILKHWLGDGMSSKEDLEMERFRIFLDHLEEEVDNEL